MMQVLLLTSTLLFRMMGGVQAHPILASPNLRYAEPGLGEDGAALSLDEFSRSDRTSLSGTAQGFPPLLNEELHTDGLRSAGFIPEESMKEGLLETPGPLHPLRRFLGPRKPYEKRGNPSECFWKYCV